MTDSILDSVKKAIGFDPTYTAFDVDLTMHINSVFSTLHQLGVGPENGFSIDDSTAVWGQFIGATPNINSVKSYVAIKVRLIFDPPATSFVIASMEKVVQEFEWRLNIAVDSTPSTIAEPQPAESFPIYYTGA